MKRFPPVYIFMFAAITYYIFMHANASDGDYDIFYQATRLFQHRLNPYSFVAHTENPYGFVYSPIALMLMFIPASIPLGFSLLFWSLCCYAMLAWCVYAWFDLITESPPEFGEFVWCFLLACIAPVFWSFWFHQLTIPILFFATISLWLIKKKNYIFIAGLASGFLLIKPHLSLPFLALLTIRTPHKFKFIAGFLLVTLLSLAPFLGGYRPLSDLKDWKKSVTNHATLLYSRDEQSIPVKIYQLSQFSRMDRMTLKRVNMRDKDAFMINLPIIRKENRFKTIAFAILLSAWILGLLFGPGQLDIREAAIALTTGVLISSYSHMYDGVLLIPLILWIGIPLAISSGLAEVCGTVLFINIFLTFAIPFDLNLDLAAPIFWDRAGYTSIFYVAVVIAAYFYQRINLSGRVRIQFPLELFLKRKET